MPEWGWLWRKRKNVYTELVGKERKTWTLGVRRRRRTRFSRGFIKIVSIRMRGKKGGAAWSGISVRIGKRVGEPAKSTFLREGKRWKESLYDYSALAARVDFWWLPICPPPSRTLSRFSVLKTSPPSDDQELNPQRIISRIEWQRKKCSRSLRDMLLRTL